MPATSACTPASWADRLKRRRARTTAIGRSSGSAQLARDEPAGLATRMPPTSTPATVTPSAITSSRDESYA